VRDSVLYHNSNDKYDAGAIWSAFIMVADNDSISGDNKSYIPIDFFLKLTSASNAAADFTQFPTGTQTVSVGNTKTFTIKSTDDSGVAPTVSVLNPPSDNSSIWDNTTSIAMVGGDNTTTFSINFAPDSSMGNKSYVVNIRSTDNAGMTKDQSLSIQVSSVANADPTAPILISPANGDNVTSPVTFNFAGSTDSDGDNVSYTMYICGNSGFVGCSGTSVTAGGNFVPPFNQNFHDNLIPWPSPLYAATSSQQISQDLSMIPKWFIMLVMLGLLSVIISSLSVKNITHRRIVFVLFWIIIGMVSCAKSSDDDIFTTTAPVIAEVTFVTTPNNDSTPNYTFSSDKAGTITYGGSCSSSTTSATIGNNTITLVSLSEGTYSNCTITVTDSAGNVSNTLTLTTFIVDSTAATLAPVTAVTTPTNDSTPNYTFSSSEAGTITYGGSCSSSTTSATTGNNTITLVSLSDGTYSNCTITVTDSAGNSVTLNISSFVIETTAPTVSSISTTADNQGSVSITDNITVTFSEAMDTTYVTTNTSDTYCSGTIRVSASSDNFSTGSCVKMSSAPASSNSNKTFTLVQCLH